MAVSFADFKAELVDAINQLRQNYRSEPETTTSAPILNSTHTVKASPTHPNVGKKALAQFIESKQLENVTQLTIKQLQQRCSDFLNYLSRQAGSKPSNSHAMAYMNFTNTELFWFHWKSYICNSSSSFPNLLLVMDIVEMLLQ